MLALIMYENKVVPSKIDIQDEEEIEEILGGEIETVDTEEYGDTSVLRECSVYIRHNTEGMLPNIVCNEEQRQNMDLAGVLLGPVIVLGRSGEGEIIPLREDRIGEVKLALTRKLLLNNFRG